MVGTRSGQEIASGLLGPRGPKGPLNRAARINDWGGCERGLGLEHLSGDGAGILGGGRRSWFHRATVREMLT